LSTQPLEIQRVLLTAASRQEVVKVDMPETEPTWLGIMAFTLDVIGVGIQQRQTL